jgi:antimicrobial peptide system SdpB family protein
MIQNHFKKINQLVDHNYWTNWLGLSRTLLAFSLLITLLSNNKITLFYTGIQNENYPKFDGLDFNLFSWFNNLETGVIVSIIVLLLVIIGVFPRYTCIAHWFVTYSFNITCSSVDGGDQVASIITLLLIPICLFDNRKWHWSTIERLDMGFAAKTIATLSYFLLSLQIFVIYFFAAIGKFKVEEWKNGTAIYYWLTQPLFGVTNFYKPFIDLLLHSPILTAFSSWSVLILELMIAFSIFTSNLKYKKILFVIGLIFHIFIFIFLGIVSFSIIMSSCLILLLISKNNNYDYRSFRFHSFINYCRPVLLFSTQKNQ